MAKVDEKPTGEDPTDDNVRNVESNSSPAYDGNGRRAVNLDELSLAEIEAMLLEKRRQEALKTLPAIPGSANNRTNSSQTGERRTSPRLHTPVLGSPAKVVKKPLFKRRRTSALDVIYLILVVVLFGYMINLTYGWSNVPYIGAVISPPLTPTAGPLKPFTLRPPLILAAVAGRITANEQVIVNKVQIPEEPGVSSNTPVPTSAPQVMTAQSRPPSIGGPGPSIDIIPTVQAAPGVNLLQAGAPPVRVSIPKIAVDSQIVTVHMRVDTWEVADFAVGHLEGTANPGDPGNLVLAGHVDVRGKIFARLQEVNPGDVVDVYADDCKGYRYTIDQIKTVDPTDTSVLEGTSTATLTLITCTPPGIDNYRLIVRATLSGPLTNAGCVG